KLNVGEPQKEQRQAEVTPPERSTASEARTRPQPNRLAGQKASPNKRHQQLSDRVTFSPGLLGPAQKVAARVVRTHAYRVAYAGPIRARLRDRLRLILASIR